jgi:hypothetical protein
MALDASLSIARNAHSRRKKEVCNSEGTKHFETPRRHESGKRAFSKPMLRMRNAKVAGMHA